MLLANESTQTHVWTEVDCRCLWPEDFRPIQEVLTGIQQESHATPADGGNVDYVNVTVKSISYEWPLSTRHLKSLSLGIIVKGNFQVIAAISPETLA